MSTFSKICINIQENKKIKKNKDKNFVCEIAQNYVQYTKPQKQIRL